MRNPANLVGWWVGVGGQAIRLVVVLMSVFFQVNTGSLPRVVGSLCRKGWSLAYLRYGKSFRPVALCLAKI